ncbi:Ubiquitin-like domain superfamily [Sesbania bispinosa]|nr:Ubiquitin-like domain superfamily [Sesbania bispinosa]
MMLRIRSRDGLERVTVDNPHNATVSVLKTIIQKQLGIPIHNQTLSTNQNLLLAKSVEDLHRFSDMSNPDAPLSSLNLSHGSIVFLAYDGERRVAGPTAFSPAGSFGRKMTMDDLIAKQMRHYVNETLAFAVKRGGFMYGTVSEEGKVEVDFIYEPPQQGRCFQAAEYHAESGLKEWVTAVVKLEVNEDMGADDDDPKLSKMKKDVVVGVKDTREVDNDFFLVVVKISDHQGPLSSTFPIENRNTQVTMRALKNHLERTKNLPFVKRISDFHLLLVLARFLDLAADVPALTECVQTQTAIPEGYQILIESMASAA